MNSIQEIDSLDPDSFRNEIQSAARPAVFRGLVRHWPLVEAARRSATTFCDYIRKFDSGREVGTAYGPPSIGGRLFYNDDLSGLNCRTGMLRLSESLQYLQEHMHDDPAPTVAIQSVIINRYLPGLELENRLPRGFVPENVEPRLWLGGRAIIAAHFDSSENIACCVAGSRRFTLFPPEQVVNLYVGPFEMTPAGTTISMVDFDQPDYERYPRFREAEAAAFDAVLEPGDAIYIPYLWWHHVRSLNDFNGLVNYWWSRGADLVGDPRNVLMHAMMAMRLLPESYRGAWRSMFEHYVFGDPAEPGQHLPAARRGILGEPAAEDLQKIKQALSRALGRD